MKRLTTKQQATVAANYGLCHFRAIYWAKRGLGDVEDLASEAVLVLIRAVRNFRPELGFTFSTYACRAMDYTFIQKAAKASARNAKARMVELKPSSMASRREAPSDERIEAKDVWERCMAVLSDRERMVLVGRLVDGQTLDDIGKMIGVTKERVRQIQNKAYEKCRELAA